jgi:hypothetical protein
MSPPWTRWIFALAAGVTVDLPASAQPRPPEQVVGRPCRDDEVPYFASGCEGPARRQCWSAAVRPMPMTFCGCDGRTSSAPLPGGGHRWRHAGACPATPPPPPTPPTPPATPTDVRAWLARCAVAGRNGLNPQIDVPTDLTTVGRAALLDAVARAPRDRRRCAAWALSRHAPVRDLRRFWRAQLTSSRDAQVLTEAFIALSELADPADLDLALRQYAHHPHLRHMLAGRLRGWRDRRVIPALVALLETSEAETTRRNAVTSIELLGFVARQPGRREPAGPGAGSGPDTTAAPYRRWWQREGRVAFAREQAAWARLVAAVRPATGLEPDWTELARTPLETPAGVPTAPSSPSRINTPAVTIECRRGPVPPHPGESPEVARSFALDPMGVATLTLTRADGTRQTQPAELTSEQRGRVRLAAAAAHHHGALSPESPPPDGTLCSLRVVVEQPVGWRVAWPTAHAPLRALMEALMPLVYPPG